MLRLKKYLTETISKYLTYIGTGEAANVLPVPLQRTYVVLLGFAIPNTNKIVINIYYLNVA